MYQALIQTVSSVLCGICSYFKHWGYRITCAKNLQTSMYNIERPCLKMKTKKPRNISENVKFLKIATLEYMLFRETWGILK